MRIRQRPLIWTSVHLEQVAEVTVDGPTKWILIKVLVAGAAFTACGATATSAPAAAITAAPGFRNGIWVGTGSPVEQELVYVAKSAMIETALSLPSSAEHWFVPSEWASMNASWDQLTRAGMVFVPGSNTADPTGMRPAAFAITEEPSAGTGFSISAAAVTICVIDTEYTAYTSTGEPVPGLLGATGPMIVTVGLEDFGGTWLVSSASNTITSACPPGHFPSQS